MTLRPTPGQTVGPFFHDALPFEGGDVLAPPGCPGGIRLTGTVFDGAGRPVPDALVEIRQADPDGRVATEPGSLHRDGWTFTGWGRAATDGAGRYTFATLAPGSSLGGGAPFFAVCVFARGLLDRLFTRAYLPDDRAALATDPLLSRMATDRRETLVATRDEVGYVFDIRLQGERETVFLHHRVH